MPMFQAIGLFALALLGALVAGAFTPAVRRDLRRTGVWVKLLVGASLLSGASAIVAQTRHAGTGFVTALGWPKPFYFRYLSETGVQSNGGSVIYFGGNTLAYAAGLLILQAVWSAVQGRSGPE